ncbi:hypothetical protein K1719_046155 [Acacia pycnantha]|nr:hypothetical protein K1719_046155 [Acacia pycnantha]
MVKQEEEEEEVRTSRGYPGGPESIRRTNILLFTQKEALTKSSGKEPGPEEAPMDGAMERHGWSREEALVKDGWP